MCTTALIYFEHNCVLIEEKFLHGIQCYTNSETLIYSRCEGYISIRYMNVKGYLNINGMFQSQLSLKVFNCNEYLPFKFQSFLPQTFIPGEDSNHWISYVGYYIGAGLACNKS